MPFVLALAILTAVRLAVAAAVPLSPDEAYYWVWSRALAPGYLDHPPMAALWIWAGTALAGDTALGVRLLGPLSAAAGSALLADAGRRLFNDRMAGIRAAVLLNATLMLGAGAVTMTPDTPLLFFWTLAAWAWARAACGGAGWWWLVAGLGAGLALDSKYTAALLGLGMGLWLIGPAGRAWLRTGWPWAGGLVAAAAFAPVVAWNAAHGWASFIKQGGRAGDWEPGRAAQFLSELLAGQVGLATPVVFALFASASVFAARRWRAANWGLCAALVAPGALVFAQHAVGDRVQANWVAVLYPGCALAAGAVGGRWWKAGAWLGLAMTAAVYVQAATGLAPLPPKLDPTLRLAGWPALARAAAAEADGAGFLASEDYGTASLLAWSAPGLPVLGAEVRWRLFGLPEGAPAGPGLLLISDKRREGPDPAFWRSAELVGRLSRGRDGAEAEGYRVYRAVPRAGAGFAVLPSPNGGAAGAPGSRPSPPRGPQVPDPDS